MFSLILLRLDSLHLGERARRSAHFILSRPRRFIILIIESRCLFVTISHTLDRLDLLRSILDVVADKGT